MAVSITSQSVWKAVHDLVTVGDMCSRAVARDSIDQLKILMVPFEARKDTNNTVYKLYLAVHDFFVAIEMEEDNKETA